VNISAMLARLATKLEISNLAEQILLLPPQPQHSLIEPDEINLLVGYSNSPASQVALDLTLYIALQTKLVSPKPVTVQMVYVAEEPDVQTLCPLPRSRSVATRAGQRATAVLDREAIRASAQSKAAQFEQADRILWQARTIAEDWRGSLKTHLRFGNLAEELAQVALTETASLLVLGCRSANDRLIRQLGRSFPCPILGIPQAQFELGQ
jgi:nucleotide-binding universal stress UspA family protein